MKIDLHTVVEIMRKHKRLPDECWKTRYFKTKKHYVMTITNNPMQGKILDPLSTKDWIEVDKIVVLKRCVIHNTNFENECPICSGKRCEKCAEMYFEDKCRCS